MLAGVLLAPTLFGGLQILGTQLVVVNEPVQVFAELGAVLLLFLVGLETKFADFKKSGLMATVVAIGGVIVPFALGYFLVIAWGYPPNEALLTGAALTATSIAITVKVLKDIGRCQTEEGKVLIGAAVIDDVLGLIVLAIVLGLMGGESLDIVEIGMITVKAVAFWLALTLFGVFVVSRIIDWLCPRTECLKGGASSNLPLAPGEHCTLKCNGTQEASMIAMCFGFAYLMVLAGLSSILGSFAAGMSVAETRIRDTIQDVTEKINFIMAPLFFVVIGTYVDLSHLTLNSLLFASVMIVLAMIGKLVGCGIPVLLMTRNVPQAIIVGLGMMSRGEVGLIIAGIGATKGVFSNEVFSAVVLMVVVTTIVTPTALTIAYKRLHFSTPIPTEVADIDCARTK